MSGGLAIAGLSVGYRGRPVLSGVNLPAIEAGTVTALVGPNGAGKSTLMRALAGLVRAAGSARLDGLELIGLAPLARSRVAGFMPQGYPAGGSLTVLESVLAALQASRLGLARTSDTATRRALAILDRLGIARLGLSPIGHLSGGQRQLAALAQAMVRSPALLLLDEPTSALDLRHQVEVMELLRALAGEGRIVVVVLHDIALAARWADRVVLLNEGKVHLAGPPDLVLTQASLAEIYGVRARVERDAMAGLRIVVEGIAGPSGQEMR